MINKTKTPQEVSTLNFKLTLVFTLNFEDKKCESVKGQHTSLLLVDVWGKEWVIIKCQQ